MAMTPGQRFLLAVGILCALTAIGTGGYVVIEGMSVVDALYMTVITLSTAGHEEVHPLHTGGEIFTIVLIITGVGTTLYLLVAIAQLVIEGSLRAHWGKAAMQRRIDQLDGHVIVCGYGRFGRAVATEIERSAATPVPVVIVERDAALEPDLTASGLPYVIGSALSDEVLDRAGIRRARALAVATGSDSDNVFITLSARERNPQIRIHARGESEAGLRRLRLAGAHQVVAPYHIGGLQMAASIARPTVVEFLEIASPREGDEIDLEEIRVDTGAEIGGRSIQDVEAAHPQLRIVAVKRADQRVRLNPDRTTPIAEGDHLVVLGERTSLSRLARNAQARREG